MALDDKLVRKKLEVLLKDEGLVENYLRTYGPRLDMACVARLKQANQKPASGEAAGVGGEKDDPTYTLKVKCPVCNQTDITCYELKAKSLTMAPDRFMVPRYAGVKPFRTINYSLISVTVCPACLFASPDKRDFTTFSVQTRSENKSQMSPFVLDLLRQKVDERKNLLATVSDFAAHFKHPRSVDSAVHSYKLATHRAMVEASLEAPLCWYKAGMYCLKSAMLLRDSGKPDETILKEAADFLAKSFRNSELAKNKDLEYQLVYTLAALYLRLGDQARCQSFLNVLEKWKGELEKASKDDPGINTALIEKWLEKIKDLWTDREDPELWKH
jgi:uncharacterized protein (DUF2225 family)